MGVPSLFRHLISKHPNIKTNDLTCSQLYLDFNAIIHESGRDLKQESDIFTNIESRISKLIDICKPKFVFISTDGVAPMAKMQQQRARRYLKQYDDKLTCDVDENPADEWAFNSNQITPGTTFMHDLDDFMMGLMDTYLQRYHEIDFVYSSSKIPGEGEHKILRNIRDQKVTRSAMIYSPDGDLLIIGAFRKLRILRDNVFKDKAWFDDCNEFICIDGNILRGEIWRNFGQGLEESRVIQDWVLLTFLCGNDFLPLIPCLDIRFGAMDALQRYYLQYHSQGGGFLTIDSKIIPHNFTSFVELMSKSEGSLYRDKITQLKYLRAKFDKDTDFEYIKLDTSEGRQHYYTNKLQVESDNNVAQICNEFLKGLCWILYLYTKAEVLNWDWYYPYFYSPLLEDLKCHRMNNIPFSSKGLPVPLYVQACIVLPESCAEFIHPTLANIVSDSRFAVTKFSIDVFDKALEWQKVAIIPPVDLHELKLAVDRVVETWELSDIDKYCEGYDILFTRKKQSGSLYYCYKGPHFCYIYK